MAKKNTAKHNSAKENMAKEIMAKEIMAKVDMAEIWLYAGALFCMDQGGENKITAHYWFR